MFNKYFTNNQGFVALIIVILILISLVRHFMKLLKIKKTQPIIISIEGNIGVGKSTLLNKLKSQIKSADFIPEPIDQWINITDDNSGKNILEVFYEDKNRWSYTFQNMAYVTRMMSIAEKLNNSLNKYIILDRSLETDRNVFAKMLHNTGYINSLEWNIYNTWNKYYCKFVKPTIKQNVIYLRCKPQISFNRIQKRGRIEEQNINLNYINDLHTYHENWLMKNQNINLLILDCNFDFEHDDSILNEYIYRIKQFIAAMIN